MNHFRFPRPFLATFCVLALLAAGLLPLAGCSTDSDNPASPQTSAPPSLPAGDQLQFDFGFFDAAQGLDKSAQGYENFVNAYFRVVILDAMANLVLAPPVAAFSAAIHTHPVAQPDGSWLWTYPWEGPQGNILIMLRGQIENQLVHWELSLAPGATLASEVWFYGTTNLDGDEGRWFFNDLDNPDQPISGEIAWGHLAGGNFLEFISHQPGEEGNTLRFTDSDPRFRIDYLPGDGSAASFIRWNADGSGSLQVPDYLDGQEACWDTYQQDADCR